MTRSQAPPGGVDWIPGRSGNRVSWDGTAVVKRYRESGWRELAVLTHLTGLPMPQLLPGSGPAAIRMAYLPGAPGRDAIEAGEASSLMLAMGRFLRKLHEVDARCLRGVLPGAGAFVVHGDFAHHNVILNAESGVPLAVLDWEGAYLGDRLTDLAWCEWQFRAAYPRHRYAVGQLFAGYAETPSPSALREALESRLESLNLSQGSAARHRIAEPRSGLLHRLSFDAVDEAAAFVGALSRAANGPDGFSRTPAQVWLGASTSTGADLLLNDAALEVVARLFKKTLGTAGSVHFSELESESRVLFVARQTPSMGLIEARRLVEAPAASQ